MSKTRDTGFLGNVIKVDNGGSISLVSGSTTLLSVSSSGAVTITGTISGSTAESAVSSSYALTASYSSNAELLDGMDSTMFAYTSSFNTTSASLDAGLKNVIARTGSFATTGSNVFYGNQTVSASMFISGSVTATGQIVAQTINVQSVTSSVVYSSGSNVFGNDISNTQTFTGSMLITGSIVVSGSSGISIAGNGMVLDRTTSGEPYLFFRKDGANRASIYGVPGGGLRVFDNNSCQVLTVTSSFLGINTATPGALLDINKCTATNINVISTNLYQNQGNLIQFSQNTTGGNVIGYIGHAGDSSGDFTIFNGANRRMSITCQGITTFTCQVCMSATAVISGGGNTLLLKKGTGNSALTFAGTSDEASALIEGVAGGGLKIYTTTGCTLSTAGWQTRLTVDLNGISTFACQVCTPGLYLGGALVSSGDAAAITLKQTSTTAATGIYLERSAEQKGYYIYVGGTVDSLTFQRNNAGTKADVMALSRDGNVGIGITSPCFGLEVYSSAQTALTSNNTFSPKFSLIFNKDNTGSTRNCFTLLADQNSAYIQTIDNYPINFVTNNQNRLLLSNTGIACFACQVCAPTVVRCASKWVLNGSIEGGNNACALVIDTNNARSIHVRGIVSGVSGQTLTSMGMYEAILYRIGGSAGNESKRFAVLVDCNASPGNSQGIQMNVVNDCLYIQNKTSMSYAQTITAWAEIFYA